ncbi:MAG TPA: sulfite exporter TauE/SafE family protein [Rhabdaerophilum sp.]|nr:sulfite exporter TauE/SafE family protein [Rhabdaerophilum sp.]
MFALNDFLLAGCLLLGAALYTTVGHAGASAYIAAMALFGLAPEVMRPTALVLNIFVASYSAWRFVKAGLFDWKVLWPIMLGAVPMAFLGGSIQLPGHVYKPLVGVMLLLAATRLLWSGQSSATMILRPMQIPLGILAGAALGLLAGLSGTGGGIFLSPLLLFMRWSDIRTTSGNAIVFILLNSIAGLLGNYAAVKALPAEMPLFLGAVMLGAFIGTLFGTRTLKPGGVRRALGVVLIIAGLKMIFTA